MLKKLYLPASISLGMLLLILLAMPSLAAPFETSLAETYGVELEPNHTQEVEAGTTVLYDHTITNTGSTTDTFLVEFESVKAWSTQLIADGHPTGALTLSLEIASQMTASVQISLTVPMTTGGTEITTITATSQMSSTVWDTAVDTTSALHEVYLPLVLENWPPLPNQPTLYSISNGDNDGTYTVSWTEDPERHADDYTLQEATNSSFTTGLRTVCTTSSQSCQVTGRTAGTYYYRVRGHNIWGDSAWSAAKSVTVLPPGTPTLNSINNSDGDGAYSVSWNATARTTSYTLQEDDNLAFSSPTTAYNGGEQSWSASGKSVGTYYYRVRAVGPTGVSSWSITRSATVQPPASIEIVEHSGANYHLDLNDFFGDKSAYGIVEVRNNTDCIRAAIELRMDIVSNLSVYDTSYTSIWDLRPGQNSPAEFSTSLPSDFELEGAYASVQVVSEGYCTSNNSQSDLDITSSAAELITPGAWSVWGQVYNGTATEQDVQVVGWARYSSEHPGLITGVQTDSVWSVPPYGWEDYGNLSFSGPPGGVLDYEVVAQRW